MARVVPIISRQELEKGSTDEVFLFFVQITHPEINDVFNLVIDGADYIWNGITWYKSYFELELLTDDEDPPEAKFSFPNVNREAIAKLRAVSTPARVSFYVIPASYFDLTVEPRTVLPGFTVQPIYSAQALFLTEISANQLMVDGKLRSWDYRTEQWPAVRVTKALLPGVYAR